MPNDLNQGQENITRKIQLKYLRNVEKLKWEKLIKSLKKQMKLRNEKNQNDRKLTTTIKHPRERKKLLEEKLTKKIQSQYYGGPLTLALNNIWRNCCCST